MAPKIKKYAPLLLIAALLPSAHLAWISRDMPHLGHIHDDAVYFVCAKSLAEGSGYRLLSFPGEPYQVKYPPLFPLLLSLVWRINPSFPDNLPLAMLLVWPLLPLYLVTARYLLLDLKIGETASWALCAVMALGPYVVFSSTTLLSELFFGTLLFACLALAQRAGSPESRTWLALAAGLLGGAAYLTRSAAIPLLVAVPLWFILRQQWKRAFVFAAAMLPAVVGWALWVRAHTPLFVDPALIWYGDYVALYRTEIAWNDVPILVWYNVRFLMNAIAGHFFFQWDSTIWGVQILTVVSLFAIAGVLRLSRGDDGATPYHWFAALSLPMMLAFHFPPTERYLMPFLPLLVTGAFVESRHLFRMICAAWTKDRANRIVGGLIGAGIVLLACAAINSVYQDLRVNLPAVIADYRQKLNVTIPAYDWVRRNVPRNGTFLAFRDPVLYLHTGNRGMRRPLLVMSVYRPERQSRAEQAGLAGHFARKVRLDYLLSTATDYDTDLIETDREVARKALLADKGLEPLFQSKSATVYRVKGGASHPFPLAPAAAR